MNQDNRKAVKVAAAVVGVASLVYGLIPRTSGTGRECGSILFPGGDASLKPCRDAVRVSPSLLWVLVIAGIGVFIYLHMQGSQANNEEN
jgi:hypothetical protein